MAKNTLPQKLMQLAERMQPQIDAKKNPSIGSQNYTRRRADIAAGMFREAERMEQVQQILRALATGHTTGDIHPLHMKIASRIDVETLRMWDHWCFNDAWLDSMERLNRIGITAATIKEAHDALEALITENPQMKAEKERKAAEAEAKRLIGIVPGYFPTPTPVVLKMLEKADVQPGDTTLEPSAGAGNIAVEIRKRGAHVDAFEISPALRDILESRKMGINLIGFDFLEASPNGKRYKKVLLNPPFERMADIDHVMHAYEFLQDGGTLVAIMSPSPFFRANEKAGNFREWFRVVEGEVEELPEGSFESSCTGVNTRLVVVHKKRPPTTEEKQIEAILAEPEPEPIVVAVTEPLMVEGEGAPQYVLPLVPLTADAQLCMF